MTAPTLLFLAGSLRRDSMNKKLARLACSLAEEAGAEASFADLADYGLPLYDEDLIAAHGFPEGALALKARFVAAHGVFLASPEYNGSYSGVLKNALDWASKAHAPNEPKLSAFKGKVYAITSASLGPLGGLRGLIALRMMLGCVESCVTPTQLAIGKGGGAFTENGTLADEGHAATLRKIVGELVSLSSKLNGL
jgi:chromate reductase